MVLGGAKLKHPNQLNVIYWGISAPFLQPEDDFMEPHDGRRPIGDINPVGFVFFSRARKTKPVRDYVICRARIKVS